MINVVYMQLFHGINTTRTTRNNVAYSTPIAQLYYAQQNYNNQPVLATLLRAIKLQNSAAFSMIIARNNVAYNHGFTQLYCDNKVAQIGQK